jgi:hypothetical protein
LKATLISVGDPVHRMRRSGSRLRTSDSQDGGIGKFPGWISGSQDEENRFSRMRTGSRDKADRFPGLVDQVLRMRRSGSRIGRLYPRLKRTGGDTVQRMGRSDCKDEEIRFQGI